MRLDEAIEILAERHCQKIRIGFMQELCKPFEEV